MGCLPICRVLSGYGTGSAPDQHRDNEWMLIIGGAVSIIFDVALVFNPVAGALAMVWFIGS